MTEPYPVGDPGLCAACGQTKPLVLRHAVCRDCAPEAGVEPQVEEPVFTTALSMEVLMSRLLEQYWDLDEMLDSFMAHGEPSQDERRRQRQNNREVKRIHRRMKRVLRDKPHTELEKLPDRPLPPPPRPRPPSALVLAFTAPSSDGASSNDGCDPGSGGCDPGSAA